MNYGESYSLLPYNETHQNSTRHICEYELVVLRVLLGCSQCLENVSVRDGIHVEVVVKVGQEEDNDKSESENEEDDGDYQDSDDHEEMRHRLIELKKYIK